MRRASEGEQARLADTFAELCRIPSPSGEEAACALVAKVEMAPRLADDLHINTAGRSV